MNMKTDYINFRRVMASLAMLGLVYLAGISSAMAESVSSQNDQELQKLFSQLETAPDSEAAELVISQIWNRWMNTSGDTTTNEMMERGTY